MEQPRYIDLYFRDFMQRLVPDCSASLLSVLTELSYALSQQHSCLDLATHPEKRTLLDELRSLKLDAVTSPIKIHGDKLYLSRYYEYEKTIVTRLSALNRAIEIPDRDILQAHLRAQFGDADDTDWQQIATLQALTRKLTIITGGPGTGKTTTVAKIIGMIGTLGGRSLDIRLAAPTGKAAMKLSQSLSLQFDQQTDLPRVQTLHRLLGVRRDGRSFRFHAENPIAADLLIVDEASMIDLPMMYRVLTALPDKCRLILVGDPDQLPSVETGNVLADLCEPAGGYSASFSTLASELLGVTLPVNNPAHPLDDVVCRLHVSHRFSPDAGIGKLSRLIRASDLALPVSGDGIQLLDPAALLTTDKRHLLQQEYTDYFALLKNAESSPQVLASTFDAARILAPMRDGELGVAELNSEIEIALEEAGLKNPASRFYHGRPILVLRNDYNLQLYNGDIGICVADNELQHPMVAFTDAEGETRMLLASRLPPHETCFAMTVHKSQGSEFQAVTLILPSQVTETTRQLLSRELVYTAVTRARLTLNLYCSADIWRVSMTNSEPRVSGLTDFFEVRHTPTETPETNQQLSLFE